MTPNSRISGPGSLTFTSGVVFFDVGAGITVSGSINGPLLNDSMTFVYVTSDSATRSSSVRTHLGLLTVVRTPYPASRGPVN